MSTSSLKFGAKHQRTGNDRGHIVEASSRQRGHTTRKLSLSFGPPSRVNHIGQTDVL
jgi:hypothetical protein